MQEITVQTLQQALKDDAIAVIDVREPWEFEMVQIAGSLNFPLSSLPGQLEELPSETPVAVICHHGMRSAQAIHWLEQQGFTQLSNVQGGIDAWAREVDHSLPTY